MAIRIICPACEESMRVADELAGQPTKCRSCGQALTVPDPTIEQVDPSSSTSGSRERFGDTFSPDALSALPAPSDRGSDAVAWATYGVALKIVTWAAVLGFVGTITYGLGTLLALTLANASLPPFGPTGPVAAATILLTFGDTAILFQLAYLTAATSVGATAGIPGTSGKWTSTSVWLFRIAVLVLVLEPTLLITGFGGGIRFLQPLILSVAVLTYLGGCAVLAHGFGIVAAEFGRDDGQLSARRFSVLQFVLGAWYMLTFVFASETPFPQAVVIHNRFAELGHVHLGIFVVAGVAHFSWIWHMTRRTARAVARHQQGLWESG